MEKTERVLVSSTCTVCWQDNDIEVDSLDFKKWQDGMFVQDAFPYLSPAQRETLLTGTHEVCWDDMFSDED